MKVQGHKAVTGVNSQSIDNGQWTDCSCDGYIGPICRTRKESRDKFEKDHLMKVIHEAKPEEER
jgi:hypothetical protein